MILEPVSCYQWYARLVRWLISPVNRRRNVTRRGGSCRCNHRRYANSRPRNGNAFFPHGKINSGALSSSEPSDVIKKLYPTKRGSSWLHPGEPYTFFVCVSNHAYRCSPGYTRQQKNMPFVAGWRDGSTYLKGLPVSGHSVFKGLGSDVAGKKERARRPYTPRAGH